MNRNFLLVFLLLFFYSEFSHSQIRTTDGASGRRKGDLYELDSSQINKKRTIINLSGKTKYTDYRIISLKNDTTYIDTTLTILKEYKFNFLRKDNFELLAFHNQGQTFNNLGYDFSSQEILPSIGMKAKHFNYLATKDIHYYEVPTPTTEILYRTGLQQGQVLETLFTLNFSRRLNAAIAYRGIRSLGNYRNSVASHGNFRTIFSYNTKNERYFIRGHISTQDLSNEENGGLTSEAINFFTNNLNI